MITGDRSVFVFEIDTSTHSYVSARVIFRTADAADEITYTGYQPAEGFRVSSTGWDSDRATAFDHWTFSVDPKYGEVDETEAERILKITRKVRIACEKITADYGTPATFGAYVQRIAKILGIKEIGFFPPAGRREWASGHRIDFLNLADGAGRIDSKLWSWKNRENEYRAA